MCSGYYYLSTRKLRVDYILCVISCLILIADIVLYVLGASVICDLVCFTLAGLSILIFALQATRKNYIISKNKLQCSFEYGLDGEFFNIQLLDVDDFDLLTFGKEDVRDSVSVVFDAGPEELHIEFKGYIPGYPLIHFLLEDSKSLYDDLIKSKFDVHVIDSSSNAIG